MYLKNYVVCDGVYIMHTYYTELFSNIIFLIVVKIFLLLSVPVLITISLSFIINRKTIPSKKLINRGNILHLVLLNWISIWSAIVIVGIIYVLCEICAYPNVIKYDFYDFFLHLFGFIVRVIFDPYCDTFVALFIFLTEILICNIFFYCVVFRKKYIKRKWLLSIAFTLASAPYVFFIPYIKFGFWESILRLFH